MVLFLSNEDVRNLLSWSDVVNVCEKLILERANGTAWFAARERWVLPTGSVFLNLPGGGTEGNFAGTRIYSQQANAMKMEGTVHNLNANSVNIVYDMKSAEMLAVTAGELINTLRTVGVAAVGAKYLARKNSRSLGLFGAGMLSFGSLMTLSQIFEFESASVYSRDPRHREQFSSKFSRDVRFPIKPVSSAAEVLSDADIVVTATNSLEPVFDGRFLHDGQHVNCIGGYTQGGGRELDENAMERFDVLSVLNKEYTMKGGVADDKPNYNFKTAVDSGKISWEKVVEISDVMAGRAGGRRTDEDITLFDGRAMGAFDVALSHRAVQLAKEKGSGTELNWKSKSARPLWA